MPAGFCVIWMQQHIHESQKNKLKKKLKSLIQLKNPKNFGSYNNLHYILSKSSAEIERHEDYAFDDFLDDLD